MKHSAALKLSYFLFLLTPDQALATDLLSLSGRIVDAETKKPIPATIFLDNTTLWATANNDGVYKLGNIPAGNYNLVVALNNQMASYTVSFTDRPVVLNLELRLEADSPKQFARQSNPDVSKKYFHIFTNYLLGNTPNSVRCIIINKDAILLEYNKKNRTLKARADKPIEIVNQALGYRLFLSLKEFEINYPANTFVFLGALRFQEIAPANKSQERRLENHREVAFYGSLTHFMRSLVNHNLSDNHFSIYLYSPDRQEHQVTEDELLTGDTRSKINLRGDLKIIYNGQLRSVIFRPTQRYGTGLPTLGGSNVPNFTGIPYFRPSISGYRDAWPGQTIFQISYIHFTGEDVTIHKNGYIENTNRFRLDGYMSYRECLSNALPLDYEPAKPLIRLNQ